MTREFGMSVASFFFIGHYDPGKHWGKALKARCERWSNSVTALTECACLRIQRTKTVSYGPTLPDSGSLSFWSRLPRNLKRLSPLGAGAANDV
jgi:hypothetical protein